MPDYPRAFQLEPITDWPGAMTERRELANFRTPGRMVDGRWQGPKRVPVGKSMTELETEFTALRATDPVLGIAVTRDDLRLDGRLRAGAKPWHPGVILSFDSPRGRQRYPSDQYTHWEDNLRAIVLTLNALRGVERWGVGDVRGAYLAIESAIAVPSAPFVDSAGARRWLLDLITREDPGYIPQSARGMVRVAQRATHPDVGGDAEQFRLVNLAERLMREADEL